MHSSFPPKDAAVFCILNAYSPPSEPGAVGQLKWPPVMSYGPLYLGNPLLGRETCIKMSLMISGRVGENKDAVYSFLIYRLYHGYSVFMCYYNAVPLQGHSRYSMFLQTSPCLQDFVRYKQNVYYRTH